MPLIARQLIAGKICMRRVAKLVGYVAAFQFVMPQISLSLVNGRIGETLLWYAVFIGAVEGMVKAFDMLFEDSHTIESPPSGSEKIPD